MFLLIAHFVADPADSPGSAGLSGPSADASGPLELLAAAKQTRWLRWARSTEDPDRAVLVAQFDSAAAYRQALAPMPMRTEVVPWLARAEITTSGVYEVLVTADRTGQASDGALVAQDVTVPDPGR